MQPRRWDSPNENLGCVEDSSKSCDLKVLPLVGSNADFISTACWMLFTSDKYTKMECRESSLCVAVFLYVPIHYPAMKETRDIEYFGEINQGVSLELTDAAEEHPVFPGAPRQSKKMLERQDQFPQD